MGAVNAKPIDKEEKHEVSAKKFSSKIVLGEACPVTFPEELKTIMFEYTGGDFTVTYSAPYDFNSLTFLGHTVKDIKSSLVTDIAVIAASHILMADHGVVLELVKENPSILYRRISVVLEPIQKTLVLKTMVSIHDRDTPSNKATFQTLPIVRYRDKTLLQIAVAEGDFRLASQLKKHLLPKDFFQQLQEQLPHNWEQITDIRLHAYKEAISQFIAGLLSIEIPDELTALSKYLNAIRDMDAPEDIYAIAPLLNALLEMDIPDERKLALKGHFALLQLCFADDSTVSKYIEKMKIGIDDFDEFIEYCISLYEKAIPETYEAKPELVDIDLIRQIRFKLWKLISSADMHNEMFNDFISTFTHY